MSAQRKGIEIGTSRALPRVLRVEERPGLRKAGDLVVDLSGIKELGLTTLSMLLTAQQQAREEDREVWLAGVSFNIWQALNAMGLARLFRSFPISVEAGA